MRPSHAQPSLKALTSHMASFQSVPHEILCEVLSHLKDDKSSLCSLGLVSRRFHQATMKFIFRHVEIKNEQSGHLLRRSLADEPNLRAYVQSYQPVRLDSDKNFISHDLSDVFECPNIQELSFNRPDKSWVRRPGTTEGL